MTRRCSICDHPKLVEINKSLVEGGPYRVIAKQFGISSSATLRHKNKHLPDSMVRAHKARQAANANNLLANVCKLQRRAGRILSSAEKSGDHRIALSAIREIRNTIELLAKLAGELQTGTTVNVLVTPEYQLLKTTIVETLAPYPDARVAVAHALKELPDAGQ
jgi:hypothetical protein